MTIRKTSIALLTIAASLLLALTACDISVWVWESPSPQPDPEPDPEPGITFSLEWTDNGAGVPHLYLTYPSPADGDTTDDFGAPSFVDPYRPPTDGGDIGFDPVDIVTGSPDEYTDDRGTVYFGDLRSSTTTLGRPSVEMIDIADESEVVIVRGFPFFSSSTEISTTGGGITGLASGFYTWVGVMEAYAYATSGQLEYESGAGVNAVLNVYDDGDLLVSYHLPDSTNLRGVSIVRINCFYDSAGYEVYHLVPDIRVIQSTTQIRSIAADAEVDASGAVTIRRPAAM